MYQELLKGFFLGLANNIYCFGVCAPVLLPYLLSAENKPAPQLLKYLTGRFIAYIIFAVSSGAAGMYFEGRINPRFFSVLMIILALWLIAYSSGKALKPLESCAWLGKYFPGKNLPLYAGLVMGLNICPPFLIGLNQTLGMNSILLPVIFFTGFYFGSSLWLIIFLFTGRLTQHKQIRTIGQLTAFLTGLWYLGESLLKLIASG